ncbi:MAG: DUF4199 domain-containing protein [Bacteroidetes bacterium]|nr:DUF4199 domain-containing protein [Bacteroidota bacterium]MBT3748855.1 DUF4199 domain-containing protein [Bacteroidota bacterium]MBT4409370.1 DUF4199 domain-containing protein [Bacteroidota bacterium]MBT7093627.1 DUF4199 domain-containing protein [Bacteroidota bacterium]MBT7463628.1 DUF4199 domain-containing protein [Bacteroidota bacterium]
MESYKSLRRKTAGTHGLIVGLVLTFMALLIWLSDIEGSRGLQLLNWAVVFASVYISMKTWRDRFCNGFISYKQALGYGVRVMLFAAIVFAVYNVVYYNILEPESLQLSMDIIEEQYYQWGYSEERIQESLELAESLQTPVFQAITSIAGTAFLGLMVSLIVAIFVRRESDPFKTAMHGVQQEEESNLNQE